MNGQYKLNCAEKSSTVRVAFYCWGWLMLRGMSHSEPSTWAQMFPDVTPP
jgi:hypothetical protein